MEKIVRKNILHRLIHSKIKENTKTIFQIYIHTHANIYFSKQTQDGSNERINNNSFRREEK